MQALVVQYDPLLTLFDVDQRSFTIDLDVLFTLVQFLHLANVVHNKKKNKRAIRQLWTKPFYVQRELMGLFRCVMYELQKVHYAEKLQIIRGTISPYQGSDDFVTFLQCSPPMFLELLERVSPQVRKERVLREPIALALKIALMLHYL